MVERKLPFHICWNVFELDGKGRIFCTQEIRVIGLSECMHSHFSLYNLRATNFAIRLESQSIGKIVGKGIINSTVIGWEFRKGGLGFEGFEMYQMSSNEETYLLHAEYTTGENFRTIIRGKMRKKGAQISTSSG